MSRQVYLIDTNVIIGLEDNHNVQPALADLSSLGAPVLASRAFS